MYVCVSILQILVGLTYGGDLREVDDTDLLGEPRELAPGENGFDALRAPSNAEEYEESRQAFDEQSDHIVALLEGRASGEVPPDSLRVTTCCPELVSVNLLALRRELDTRAEDLSQLEEILGSPAFVVTMRESGATYPEMGRAHNIAYTAQAEAALLYTQGELEMAVGRALDIVRLGRRFERGRGGLLAYLVGLSIRGVGVNTLQWILVAQARRGEIPRSELLRHIVASCEPSADTSSEMKALIRAFYAWDRHGGFSRDSVAKVLVVEFALGSLLGDGAPVRRCIIETVPPWAIHGACRLASHVIYQPRRSLAQLAGMSRAMIAQIDASSQSPDRPLTPGELDRNLPPTPARWTNLLGERLVSRTVEYTVRAVVRQRRDVDRAVRATILAATLLGHRQEHGGTPASLDTLVPEWLDEVPVDPHDGEPFELHAVDGVWELHCDPLATGDPAEDDYCCDEKGPPPWHLWPVERNR